jgi:transposase
MFSATSTPHEMTPAKKHSKARRQPKRLEDKKPLLNPCVHPDAAGIDVGAEELVAAVPPGRGVNRCVRSFSSFTSGVHALRDWLLECGIKTAALESTGNYWITTYTLLEEAGIEVCLVNARHVKGVPGKKSDVLDAQWLQQLHAAGLLKKSFRPTKDIVPLRYLMRHRSEMVAEASRQVQLMQKVLTEMNLHIHHVFSDVDGESAQRIISAILAGERDAEKLAALRDRRCRSPLARIIEALRGDYRSEYLFVLGQCQKRWQQCLEAMNQCDQKISQLAAAVMAQSHGPLPQPEHKSQHTVHKNSLQMSVYEEAWRFYGVDLSSVEGIGSGTLSVLMSELGTGAHVKAAFRSAEAFSSWQGLCPDNRISGGKVLKAKTRKVPNRVATALRLAAQGLQRSESQLGQYLRRMKARLGKAEGITATAHKLARICWAMITTRRPYDEAEAFKQTPSSKARRIHNLLKQATKLGLQLVPAAT